MKKEELLVLASRAPEDASLAVDRLFSSQAVPYLFRDNVTKEVSLAAAFGWQVRNAKNGNLHNVVIACKQGAAETDREFFYWCGDPKFLEADSASAHDELTARMASLDHAVPAKTTALLKAVAGSMSAAKSAGCNFWSQHAKGLACKHVNQVLAIEVDVMVLAELEEKLVEFHGTISSATTKAPATATLSWLDRLPFKVPVLLQGDRGSGKTHDVFAFARERSFPMVVLPGHEGVQSADVLGHLVPYGAGDLVWKDGPLSEAFRRAKSEKVVLLIDELLRIPQRELSVLLTALTPIDGNYNLATGRMVDVVDGVGRQEVLSCPVANIAVFATTNVGGQYAVDECDPALAERFVPVQKDTDEKLLRAILARVVAARGFTDELVGKLVLFFRTINALVDAGSLNRAPTTRTLVRSIDLATSEEDVEECLRLQSLLWVDLDSKGRPDAEQLKLLETAFSDIGIGGSK